MGFRSPKMECSQPPNRIQTPPPNFKVSTNVIVLSRTYDNMTLDLTLSWKSPGPPCMGQIISFHPHYKTNWHPEATRVPACFVLFPSRIQHQHSIVSLGLNQCRIKYTWNTGGFWLLYRSTTASNTSVSLWRSRERLALSLPVEFDNKLAC